MQKKIFKKRMMRVRAKTGDKNKDGLSFSSKIISTDGIVCLIMGIACIIILLAGIVISTINRGEAEIYVGIMGVAGLIVSLVSFITSVKILNNEYIAEKIPKIAAVLNFIALIIFMGIYAYGIFTGMV